MGLAQLCEEANKYEKMSMLISHKPKTKPAEQCRILGSIKMTASGLRSHIDSSKNSPYLEVSVELQSMNLLRRKS